MYTITTTIYYIVLALELLVLPTVLLVNYIRDQWIDVEYCDENECECDMEENTFMEDFIEGSAA